MINAENTPNQRISKSLIWYLFEVSEYMGKVSHHHPYCTFRSMAQYHCLSPIYCELQSWGILQIHIGICGLFLWFMKIFLGTEWSIGYYSRTASLSLTSIRVCDMQSLACSKRWIKSLCVLRPCGLVAISIPDSVCELGSGCFIGCSKLGTVKFSSLSSLERIGVSCFKGTGVKGISFPESVQLCEFEP